MITEGAGFLQRPTNALIHLLTIKMSAWWSGGKMID